MNFKDLQNLDKDDLLSLLGLEKKPSTGGTFGLGMLVGAGIALILAPKPGRELRKDIRDRLRSTPNGVEEELPSDQKAADAKA